LNLSFHPLGGPSYLRRMIRNCDERTLSDRWLIILE
jgi:hypothetical protein